MEDSAKRAQDKRRPEPMRRKVTMNLSIEKICKRKTELASKTARSRILIADSVLIAIHSLLVLAWTIAQDSGLKRLGKICETVVGSYTDNDFIILNLPFVIVIYYGYLAFRHGVGNKRKAIVLALLNLAALYAVCFVALVIFMMLALLITGGRLG
ncbi:MAG: hypothetical protein LBC37_05125 [Zoogloeaceae bacterium]|jgi:hypothetical protein|nr:hypothetical protein [Zoogloeaceae bacterium]